MADTERRTTRLLRDAPPPNPSPKRTKPGMGSQTAYNHRLRDVALATELDDAPVVLITMGTGCAVAVRLVVVELQVMPRVLLMFWSPWITVPSGSITVAQTNATVTVPPCGFPPLIIGCRVTVCPG